MVAVFQSFRAQPDLATCLPLVELAVRVNTYGRNDTINNESRLLRLWGLWPVVMAIVPKASSPLLYKRAFHPENLTFLHHHSSKFELSKLQKP